MGPVADKIQQLLKRKESGALVAFLLYEDSASCARAEEFCQELIRTVTVSQLSKRAWLCNQLRQNRLRNIAIQETLSADIVVLSLHYAETLAPEVTGWLKAWLAATSRQPRLIVGLFEEIGPGAFSSMQADLEQITTEAGIDLVVVSSHVPEDGVAY